MNKTEKLLKQYDYSFPTELIAQSPAHPRDSARLLVYDRNTKQISHDTYKNLASHLPKHAALVLNNTKVLPARLVVSKPSGGKIKLLYVGHDEKVIHCLANNKLTNGQVLNIDTKKSFTVMKKGGKFYELKPNFATKNMFKILETFGQTPLPPYIKHSPLKGKRLLSEYNTVFAKQLGSVAAPTASLHFTKTLLKKIEQSGVAIKYVTLHVNLGTFATLTPEQIKQKKLHSEYYEIDKATAKFLNDAKKSGRPIVAVGTTVVRTLESAAAANKLVKLNGQTRLFLTEKSKLKFVNQLITNFHVPKSSLLMLVSAFVNRRTLLALYKLAISKKYRLFSFGDGMIIK